MDAGLWFGGRTYRQDVMGTAPSCSEQDTYISRVENAMKER